MRPFAIPWREIWVSLLAVYRESLQPSLRRNKVYVNRTTKSFRSSEKSPTPTTDIGMAKAEYREEKTKVPGYLLRSNRSIGAVKQFKVLAGVGASLGTMCRSLQKRLFPASVYVLWYFDKTGNTWTHLKPHGGHPVSDKTE